MREAEENLKPGQIVKCREFWILWFTFFLNTQVKIIKKNNKLKCVTANLV
jgi:hypothetical protein